MLFEVLITIVCIGYLAYKLATKNLDYWEKAGVPHRKPYPLLGNVGAMVFQRETPMNMLFSFYKEFPDKRFNGMFMFQKPFLFLRDPELIKQVMVKDFDYFIDRNDFIDEESEPILGKGLFTMRGEAWRESRHILSPTFTGSKMKTMFQLINTIGEQMSQYLAKKLEQEKDSDGVLQVECKDLFTRFANDVIATSAFGIKVDSLQEPTNEFYMMGKRLSNFGIFFALKSLLRFLLPGVKKKMQISLLDKTATDFFANIIIDTIKERDDKKIVRNDVLHLLMEARAIENTPGLKTENIVSQSISFFFAGFETISVFLSFAAYELALNPEVQGRLQEEIKCVTEEDGGQLTYEGVMYKMKYLDQVVSEVLRKWPPNPFLDRKAVKPYKIDTKDGEPDVHLNPGDVVFIPAVALQYDPQYFPDPEVFDPERFSEENKKNMNPFTYMPFGMGPRNCVGMRFALMEGKLCLVHILSNFNFVPTAKTEVPIKLKKGFIVGPVNGYNVGLKQRK